MPNEYDDMFAGYMLGQMSLDFDWAMVFNDMKYGMTYPLWSDEFRDFYAMYMMMSV